MLKVIGAGLPRTGTTSLKAALERLGFGPCYHMFEILAHPDHVDRWLPFATGMPMDWNRVFDGYQSSQDWPASHFWREQADAYPHAKVILTVRDPHRWYASFQNLISNAPGQNPADNVPDAIHPVIDAMTRLRPVIARIGQSTFGGDWRSGPDLPDEEQAVQVFRRHVTTVRESLPADRLLIFDVREGWQPLCRFLNVEPPTGEPFPHLNDSEAMQTMFDQLMTEGHMTPPFNPRS
jgi:sulfotransferase family protein